MSAGSNAFKQLVNYYDALPAAAPAKTRTVGTSITGSVAPLYFPMIRSGADSWVVWAKAVKGTDTPAISIGQMSPDLSTFIALDATSHPQSIATVGADGWVVAYSAHQGISQPYVKWDPRATNAELVDLWGGPIGPA